MNDGAATIEKDESSLLKRLKITDSEPSIIGIGRKMGDITGIVGDSQARVIEKFGLWWKVVKDDVFLGKGGPVDELPSLKSQDDKDEVSKEDMISKNINWLREIAGGKKNWMRLRKLVMDKGEKRVDFVVMAAALLFPKDLEKRDQLIDKAIDEVERVWDDRVSREALRLPFFKKNQPMDSLFGRALLRMRAAKETEV